MADDEQFSLCWNNFNTNLSAGFHESLVRGDLVDVTLAAEGQLVKAHRLILSVCSPYFRKMFTQMPANQHAFIFLKDVSHSALKDLIQFMYCGEVNVKQDALPAFISTAEALQIKGLTETGESASTQQPSPAKEASHLPSASSTTIPSLASSPRAKPIVRSRIQSYKLDSDDGSDHEKVVQIQATSTPASVASASSSTVTTQVSVPQQVQILQQPTPQAQKRTIQQRASITPQQTAQVMKRAKLTDPLEASEPTQIQTVQIVKQITPTPQPSISSEPEYVEMPIETINPKAEPEYADDPSEVEAIETEHEQEQSLAEQEATEHDQAEDDSAHYVEDETYGDMSKYDETYFAEGDDPKAGASGFSESYAESGTGADQAAQAPSSTTTATSPTAVNSSLMEPTIKIEEDSVEFDEYAFYSAHNVVKADGDAGGGDDSSEDDKQGLLLPVKPKRSAARLQIEDLFQISSVCSQNRNLLKQPFPIQTVNELNELDTLLLGNPTFMEKCAQMLHNAIQNEALENVTGHMRLLLEFAIDYSVLLKYSWFGFLPRSPIARGMGEQQPFRNLIGVIHLLHRARRLRFGKCSLEEIHEGIEKFLKRKLRCHALFVKKQNYVIQGMG